MMTPSEAREKAVAILGEAKVREMKTGGFAAVYAALYDLLMLLERVGSHENPGDKAL